jgi:hypothetical protein
MISSIIGLIVHSWRKPRNCSFKIKRWVLDLYFQAAQSRSAKTISDGGHKNNHLDVCKYKIIILQTGRKWYDMFIDNGTALAVIQDAGFPSMLFSGKLFRRPGDQAEQSGIDRNLPIYPSDQIRRYRRRNPPAEK